MVITASPDTVAQPLFLVRVTTHKGSFSVAYSDPDKALKAVKDFHESGFSSVGIYDAEGQKLGYADMQNLQSLGRKPD